MPTDATPEKPMEGQVAGLTPAVIVVDPSRCGLRVAGLPLVERLIVMLHRAGCGPLTVVTRGALPILKRARAWGIQYRVESVMPVIEASTLILRADVLVTVPDLKRIVEAKGRLLSSEGERFPVGLVSAGNGGWDERLDSTVGLRAEGAACWVRNELEAREAGKILWKSLTSSSDGWVDRVFNRPVGRPLARGLSRTWVTPNQISLASILLGVLAGILFAVGRYEWSLAGAIVFQISAIIDCVDGDVARIVYKETAMGKWLDLVGDQVVHVAVFLGIAVGLARAGADAPVGWLGMVAIAGAILSFLIVLRGMKQRTGVSEAGMMGRFLDAATNRDFSVLVFGLACADWLEVFLWLAAVGSHVFWILLLWFQSRIQPAGRGGR